MLLQITLLVNVKSLDGIVSVCNVQYQLCQRTVKCWALETLSHTGGKSITFIPSVFATGGDGELWVTMCTERL